MTYLPYPYGWSDYSNSMYDLEEVADKLFYWQWVEQYGGKVVDHQDLPGVEWRLEFKDDADAVVFKLKFGK
jgi:hypothetical protein